MGWRGAHREDEGGTMSDISRRNLLKGAAVSAVSISAMGLLGACAAPSEPKAETTTDPSADGTGTGSGTNSEYMAEVLEPTSMPDASTASNFNIIYDSKTTVGTTYENLMTAIAGETGATTKYEAFSKVAKNEGFDVLARLFQCTADAEKIHIGLEYDLAKEIDPATEKPEPPAVEEHESDINLISGANGEIYETHHNGLAIITDKMHSQVTAPGYSCCYAWGIRHLPGNPWDKTRIDDEEHLWLLEDDANDHIWHCPSGN